MSDFHRSWHLAETSDEVKITEFELQLWRVFNGFIRWQESCEKIANGIDLTGSELAVLHVIRMTDRPKNVNDIMRLLNRDDTFNIHYSIRKLLKIGLIKKLSSNKKAYAYEITEEGIKNTDLYRNIRKNTLIDLFSKEEDLSLEGIVKTLAKLKAIYDEADRVVASYSRPKEQEPSK